MTVFTDSEADCVSDDEDPTDELLRLVVFNFNS